MDKPKCKVCGERHWATEPHVFPQKRTTGEPEVLKPVPAEEQHEALRGAMQENGFPDPREVCPTCGRPKRALTPAERQARFRARKG